MNKKPRLNEEIDGHPHHKGQAKDQHENNVRSSPRPQALFNSIYTTPQLKIDSQPQPPVDVYAYQSNFNVNLQPRQPQLEFLIDRQTNRGPIMEKSGDQLRHIQQYLKTIDGAASKRQQNEHNFYLDSQNFNSPSKNSLIELLQHSLQQREISKHDIVGQGQQNLNGPDQLLLKQRKNLNSMPMLQRDTNGPKIRPISVSKGMPTDRLKIYRKRAGSAEIVGSHKRYSKQFKTRATSLDFLGNDYRFPKTPKTNTFAKGQSSIHSANVKDNIFGKNWNDQLQNQEQAQNLNTLESIATHNLSNTKQTNLNIEGDIEIVDKKSISPKTKIETHSEQSIYSDEKLDPNVQISLNNRSQNASSLHGTVSKEIWDEKNHKSRELKTKGLYPAKTDVKTSAQNFSIEDRGENIIGCKNIDTQVMFRINSNEKNAKPISSQNPDKSDKSPHMKKRSLNEVPLSNSISSQFIPTVTTGPPEYLTDNNTPSIILTKVLDPISEKKMHPVLTKDNDAVSGAEIMMALSSAKVKPLDTKTGIICYESEKKSEVKSSSQTSLQSEAVTLLTNISRQNLGNCNKLKQGNSNDKESELNQDSNSKNQCMSSNESDSINHDSTELDFLEALPKLPEEPEYEESLNQQVINGSYKFAHVQNMPNLEAPSNRTAVAQITTKVYGPTIMHVTPSNENNFSKNSIAVDTWWPSIGTIKKEKSMRECANDVINVDHIDDVERSAPKKSSLSRHRKKNWIEPGVLEKIPHCKIHSKRCRPKENGTSQEPLFCFQVTELYPNAVMLCCSICFTWRHACCGGHHSKAGSKLARLNKQFIPTCDQCFEEKKLFPENSQMNKLIGRQSKEHLRRTMATNFVMRQASYAKCGSTFKWPLGSVPPTHIGGHTRSVNGRYERSERQWNEISMKFDNNLIYRPKERVKFRARELERLLGHIEDAEFATDQHNMMLFLERDTRKAKPAGYNITHRNIFDPADDVDEESIQKSDYHPSDKSGPNTSDFRVEEGADSSNSDDNSTMSVQTMHTKDDTRDLIEIYKSERLNGNLTPPSQSNKNTSDQDEIESCSNIEKKETQSTFEGNHTNNIECNQEDSSSVNTVDADTSAQSLPMDTKSLFPSKQIICCARPKCDSRPRYDSLFCSDACGVSALEMDLMRCFEYSRLMHPALSRP